MKVISVINGTFQDIEQPRPAPGERDLLVKVEAISVNPVDVKQFKAAPHDGEPRVLGWDVAGTVVEAGSAASLFKAGDQVFYAGSITRPGANSEYHVVDERIVGRKPATLDYAQAAALPLTSITAWEALTERLGIDQHGADAGKTLLIIGGAGGVGSIAIQLAKKLLRLNVVGTASRPESAAWCRSLGADQIVDHFGDIPAQLRELGLPAVDFILCLNDLDRHFPAIAEAIAPQGKICAIVRNEGPLALELLFAKSATFVYELMFTRSMFGTADIQQQHELLNQVASLIDDGVLTTTFSELVGRINAHELTRAHEAVAGGRSIGKLVLAGF
jgi:NADPH2:quinone reductase